MKYLKMPESNLTCNSLVQLSNEPYIRNGKSWFVSKIVKSLIFNQGWAEGVKSTPTSFLKIASFRRNRFLKFQPPSFWSVNGTPLPLNSSPVLNLLDSFCRCQLKHMRIRWSRSCQNWRKHFYLQFRWE